MFDGPHRIESFDLDVQAHVSRRKRFDLDYRCAADRPEDAVKLPLGAIHLQLPTQGRASSTILNGVSVARRNRLKPPCSTTTARSRCSPACAPSAGPCLASDTGTQINA